MGFKRGGPRPPPKSKSKPAPKAGTSSGRGRGRTAGRGQKRKSDAVESDSSPEAPVRKHVLYDDDDEPETAYREEGGKMIGDIWIPPAYKREEHPMTGVRLVIEKIVCENFKSYGGVKQMGPFHKNFSAIVGPNGNGKSNIIDAMLFVFGYRATKIRCKKISVLIHKSELLPDVEWCGVTVHFVKINDTGSDDDSFDIIPDSHIEVTRRAFRNNTSQYLLNGKTVKFQDVANFLKEGGIDIVHNRFLILQGEVESIAQMPPKRKGAHDTGLLEFLEEVIGTKRYMRCLVALEDRVDSLNFDRETKLVAVDICENEKRELKEPVRAAKEYLRNANSAARAQHKVYQWKQVDVRKNLEKIEDDKKIIKEVLLEIKGRLEQIEKINKEKEATYITQEKEAKRLEAERAKLKKALDAAEAEYAKNTEQLKSNNQKRKRAQKELGTVQKELEELEQVPANNEGQVKLLAARMVELKEKIEVEEKSVSKDLEKLQGKIQVISKEKEGADKHYAQLKKVKEQKSAESERFASELKVYKDQADVEKRKYDALKKDVEGIQEKVKNKQREARSSIGNTIGPLEDSLQQKTGESQAIDEEERQKHKIFDKIRTEYEGARDAMEGSLNDDVTYKAFNAEKKQGRLLGLYGRLKDLAKIDEKYNVAITVATHLWDHWICDNDVTAEQCIQTLKQKGLQYQNFICLNKLTSQMQQMKRAFNAPRESLRLFDLLQFSKPEVAPAFYKAVRDTVVVKDLDLAKSIAYERGGASVRVTTLVGEIIDPSGAMTGGGRQAIKGKLNSQMADRLGNSISPEEFNRLKINFEKARKDFEDVKAQKETLEQDIRQITLKLKDLKKKAESSKTDIESWNNQLVLTERRLNEQETIWKKCIVDPAVVKQKEAACKKAQKEFEAASEPCDDAEEKANEIREKLNSLQVDKTKEIRKKLDFLIDQQKKVIEDHNKYSIALTNYPKTKAKLEKKIDTLTKDIHTCENLIRELDASKKSIAERSTGTNEELAEIDEKATNARKEVEKLKKTANEFQKEQTELEKKEAHHANEWATTLNNEKVYASQIAAFKGQIDKLELHPIPDEALKEFEVLTLEELKELRLKDLEAKAAKYYGRIKNEKPNLGVLAQYKQKVDEFTNKVAELDKITLKRDEFRTAYINTTAQRLSEFMEGFAVISSKLKEMFRMISMGGDAELELVDSTDPFSFGIEISVRPARKTWKKIQHLSGGEKTLSSLALVFALHHYKPSPFYVMDEIDAALDFKNVSIIANYIKDRTKFTQFIIISLRSNMFELADSMLGVYKVDNMSYSIHIGIGRLLAQLKQKFEQTGRPFPFQNEYIQNNRGERKKVLAESEAVNKSQFELDDATIRDLDLSLRPVEAMAMLNAQNTPVRTPLDGTPRVSLSGRSLTARLSLAATTSPAPPVSPSSVPNSQAEVNGVQESQPDVNATIIPDSQPDVNVTIIPDSQPDVNVIPDSQPVILPSSSSSSSSNLDSGNATFQTPNGHSNEQPNRDSEGSPESEPTTSKKRHASDPLDEDAEEEEDSMHENGISGSPELF